jgi:hypothetical protein
MKSSGKEPSGRARSRGPLLDTTSTSTQQAASASAMDHHGQPPGRTLMRCVRGPGASDGASTGQWRTADPRRRELVPTLNVPVYSVIIGKSRRVARATARDGDFPAALDVACVASAWMAPQPMPTLLRRPGCQTSTDEAPSARARPALSHATWAQRRFFELVPRLCKHR